MPDGEIMQKRRAGVALAGGDACFTAANIGDPPLIDPLFTVS
jgi:hypothetical protein